MNTITDTITSVQDQVLDAVRTIVDNVEDQLPENRPTVPFVENLPDPVALVDAGYDFAQKVLDNSHEFAKALAEAIAPLVVPAATKPTPVKSTKATKATKAA